jgi:hypothetical protein
MAYNIIGGFPTQQLSFKRKNNKWRVECVDFGDLHSLLHNQVARKSFLNMNINYDLLYGKLHMEDLKKLLNPYHLEASFIPDEIQHYPIMNSKLEVLKGEESKRLFDYKLVITNPNAISEAEETKNQLVNEKLQELIADESLSEEDFQQKLQKLSDYFQYEYQDKREIMGNCVLTQYIKELELPQKFNSGFEDAYTVGEEIYQVDIVSGEPFVEKLNPRDVRIIRSGLSNKIEDADMIIIEQYWNPGRIIDTYWDQLSKKDIEKLENGVYDRNTNDDTFLLDAEANYNPIIPVPCNTDWTAGERVMRYHDLFDENPWNSRLPYDLNGNIRVLRVYWKSRRKIKKVKSYDPETGEEQFNFYPENYIIDPNKGEEEQSFWVNEAWEGTKIGESIYVNMRPRPVQYNRLSNPSLCHFGIIGSIYTNNGEDPYSLVDIMKPYAYLYDVYHDRLNKTLAKNVGKVIRLDFAKVPQGWDAEKWLYYINVNGVAVENSFKEGDYGKSMNVMAGQMNNASSGVIDASLGNEIQQYISVLEWIANKVGELAGITKQREGQISNRETVGGVERATLQSSHSTEWLFFPHESVKKRVLECILDTFKIAYRGRKKKFEYILADGSKSVLEVDGDLFAECDFGLVVDNSGGAQELNQKLEGLAQAGLQNQLIDFSTMMKIFTTGSMAEKQRLVEAYERRNREMQQQQQEQQMQLQQQQMQLQAQQAQYQAELQYKMHQEDNETKILVAQINAQAEAQRFAMMNHDNDEANTIEREKLAETARQFDAKIKQDNAKLELEKQKAKDDARLKEKQINKQSTNKK